MKRHSWQTNRHHSSVIMQTHVRRVFAYLSRILYLCQYDENRKYYF